MRRQPRALAPYSRRPPMSCMSNDS
jgi:hypothetical protein